MSEPTFHPEPLIAEPHIAKYRDEPNRDLYIKGAIARAKNTVEWYAALVKRALDIATSEDKPFCSYLDEDDRPALSFDGDDVVLTWTTFESDYYNSCCKTLEVHKFPAWALFTPDSELVAMREKAAAEECER